MLLTILAIVSVILVAVIIFQVAQTTELISVLKGEGEGEISDDTNSFAGMFFMGFLVLGLIGSYWSVKVYLPLFLPEASSIHGVELDYMFNITLLLTGIVFVITHIALFWFAYKYRGRKNGKAYYYPHNNKLELIWTVIPAIVLTVLVILGIKAWLKATGPAPQDAMVVEVIGQQFNWNVRYPGKDGVLGKTDFAEMSTDNITGMVWEDKGSHDDFMTNEIHLIVNKPVLFKLGAKDVLHSFYLPHFRVKMDCVPGIPTQFWFTPTATTADMIHKTGNQNFEYFLACAELCGSAHWNMKVKLIVGTEEEYKAWHNQQKPLYESVKANLQLPEMPAEEQPEKAQIEKTEAENDSSLISAL